MTSNSLNVNHRMQRTATLAREVLERARSRKLNWPIPGQLQRRTFREGDGKDVSLAAAFASVAEHMGRISAECENYYCCVSPLQFKECEVAHTFRYHSRQASENLLKAFENEDIYVEVSPGTYRVSASLQEDTIKQTHLLKIKPGESVNLTFDF